MRLATSGRARNFSDPLVGRITLNDLPLPDRNEHIRLFPEGASVGSPEYDLHGYRAVVSHDDLATNQAVIDRLRVSDHLREGDIVALEPNTAFVRSIYRPHEKHHALFVTERCSSNCLMCSQPPKDRDDTGALTKRNRELIRLMRPTPPYLTITGGEPTLLGDHLFTLIADLKDHLPDTELHMLTNGRTFAWQAYAQRFRDLGHPNICLGIPLYSDFAGEHDHVVQAKGAFDQTVAGLHQLARVGIRVEIRVVLHRLTVPRLTRLAEFIYRNFPFAEHVALMGLEHTGYTPRNIDQLWIDPFDYQTELESATRYLAERDMTVSIYNHQLCVLPGSLWRFAQKSISDWKNAYLPECENCCALDQCGGLFKWALSKHSDHIHTLHELPTGSGHGSAAAVA